VKINKVQPPENRYACKYFQILRSHIHTYLFSFLLAQILISFSFDCLTTKFFCVLYHLIK